MVNTKTDDVQAELAGNTQAKPLRLPIATLAPDPKNPRRMTDEARTGLAVSLETFGDLNIVFNETTKQLVSGHMRVAALKAAGATEFVREAIGRTSPIPRPASASPCGWWRGILGRSWRT